MPCSSRTPEGSRGVASGKARILTPAGEEDRGICEGRDQKSQEGGHSFIHRHSQSTNHAQQAFGNQGRLHGGGDLGGEPGKLHRGPACGGQSRGFSGYSLQKRMLLSGTQETVYRRQFPVAAAQLGMKEASLGAGLSRIGAEFSSDRAPSHPTHHEQTT